LLDLAVAFDSASRQRLDQRRDLRILGKDLDARVNI
jgi:hypothetical protein